jgi:hypothetical protein
MGIGFWTWGFDGTVRLWARDHKEPIRIFKAPGMVTDAAFISDEDQILALAINGPARLWDISLDDKIPLDERTLEFQVRSATKVSGSSELKRLTFDEWMAKARELEAMRTKRLSLK